MRVWTVRPRRGEPAARVLYVHGGGYVHPLSADYWRLVRSLCRAAVEVVVPAYPLAPEATVDDVLPRLLDVQARASDADPQLPSVLMGDSAGGALVIAMALRLRDLGRPLPAGVVALSPWLDATLDEQAVEDLEASDPMLAESGLRAAGRWWAGLHGPSHPYVSPVQANLEGLPPLDVFIGSHDILRPAVDAFADRARGYGADLHVHENPAMFHVWMTRAIPEGRRTRRELARLVRLRAADA
jgi:acetyl esterase/lipase